jgi:AraC family transcriptional regulator
MSSRPPIREFEYKPAPLAAVVSPANGLRVLMHSDEPGVLEVPGLVNTVISIHVGRPVQMLCRRGGESHRGTAIHGDVDIVPSGIPAIWENKEKDTVLICSLSPKLLEAAAEGMDFDPDRVEIRNRFQMRDAQIEHVGWALKAEMERGYPSGRLYADSLAMALAARLLHNHSSLAQEPRPVNGDLNQYRMKHVLSFIEDQLGDDLSLETIAGVAGVSVPHFKVLFRRTVGMPVHRYVIGRRVERAAALLREGQLPISQIALDAGFAHQSHLARHMRRVLGVSPSTLRDSFR